MQTKPRKPTFGTPLPSSNKNHSSRSKTDAASTPAERTRRWKQQFEAESIEPELLRELVNELITSRQFEEVIACLEQAIIQAKIQPWMYEVLALSMSAAGRPKTQIERVLLSSQDLVATDADSMMMLAAYLTKFDQDDRALELYRQAAHLAPHRPEPFLQAMAVARRTRNAEAIVWSAPEVLAYAWGSDREALRREAEQASADAMQQLIKVGKISKAIDLQNGMQAARQLDLVVRLDWNGPGDLDLLIEEPTGSKCSMDNPSTSSGGIFVHDGFGPNQARCYDEYLCPKAISGDYVAHVRHVWGDIVGKRARLTITRGKNSPREQLEIQSVLLGRTDQKIRFSLAKGSRLEADQAIPEPLQKQSGRQHAAGNAILAQIDGNAGSPLAARSIGLAAGNNVGYQPLVTLINEGVTMTAIAVVSADRRYVRISTAPVFTKITDVLTFSALNLSGSARNRR